jgi:hypothetical protein
VKNLFRPLSKKKFLTSDRKLDIERQLSLHQFEGSDNDTGKNDTKFTPKGTLCAVDYRPHFLVQNLIQKSLVK